VTDARQVTDARPACGARDEVARSARRAELSGRLRAIRERIAAACAAAGRSPGEITLVAVTKTWPASDVRLLSELGVTDFGENRDQEAAPKAASCAGLPITWHFVGQLQTNKCASVARYADVVHSVDRMRLIGPLGAAARRAGRTLTCLIQVSLDVVPGAGPAGTGLPGSGRAAQDAEGAEGRLPRAPRAGAREEEVRALAEAVAGESGLVLGGVMAIAPLGYPPRPAFERLARSAAVVRAVRNGATIISAGMSGDFEEAIAAGATHLRIGTALLGDRRPAVR